MRIFLAQINPILGKFTYNRDLIVQAILDAKKAECELVIFPELALCGYSPEDLLFLPQFIEHADRALKDIVDATSGITAIVGTVRKDRHLYNTACIISNKEVVGFQDKSLLPTYDVFDERRYFSPAASCNVWNIGGKKVCVTICEDIWFTPERYDSDPLQHFADISLDLFVNISASPYSYGKIQSRQAVAKKVSHKLSCPVVLVNQVGAQDGLLFDGSSFVLRGDEVLVEAKRFESDGLVFTGAKQEPAAAFRSGEELFKALVMGVRDYFRKQSFTKACVGLSGGIDSSVVAAIAAEALGKENVVGLFMPSRFTRDISAIDAASVAENLGIQYREHSIEPYLELFIGSNEIGVAEENLQSRIRGLLLMQLSNNEGHLVLNTGNKSEIAMGYTTLYGDAVGAIGVLGDMLKRQVQEVAGFISAIPKRVLTREPSAELRYNQKDSDSLPEYPILDQIVDDFIVKNRSVEAIVRDHGEFARSVIEQIHRSEHKRRQLPFSLRVSEKAFSTGRYVPIVSSLV